MSLMQMGENMKRAGLGTHNRLAQSHVQREQFNDQIDANEDAQKMSAIGTGAGTATMLYTAGIMGGPAALAVGGGIMLLGGLFS